MKPDHPPGVSLLCSSCELAFGDPLDLMLHVQAEHSIEIFERSEESKGITLET